MSAFEEQLFGNIYCSDLRGGVIIKKRENLGQSPKKGGGGGGSEKKQKSLKFKFGHLKTDGGGLNFSKMSQL